MWKIPMASWTKQGVYDKKISLKKTKKLKKKIFYGRLIKDLSYLLTKIMNDYGGLAKGIFHYLLWLGHCGPPLG